MTSGRVIDDEIVQLGRAVARIVRQVTGDPAYHVFLFGSWASGHARERSDVDIGVLGPEPLDPVVMQQIREACESLPTLYTIDVVGEVLRDGKMWEKYRYRFDFTGDLQDEKLPIIIDRMLRPAAYRSRVKLTDPSTGAQAILENDLEVPEVADALALEEPAVEGRHGNRHVVQPLFPLLRGHDDLFDDALANGRSRSSLDGFRRGRFDASRGGQEEEGRHGVPAEPLPGPVISSAHGSWRAPLSSRKRESPIAG